MEFNPTSSTWSHRLPVIGAMTPKDFYHGQWTSPDQFTKETVKYWYQRNRIWKRFDEGVWMTEEAWYGVTPEPIANKIAKHIAYGSPPEKKYIIDAFAGVGGNAIAFARNGRWDTVFALEKDPKAMECAKHNAELYGVRDKIVFIEGDCFEQIPKRFSGTTATVIFASPPWGGVSYGDQEVFDLTKMEPYNLETLHQSLSKVSTTMAFYLPRTSDLNQLAKYAPDPEKTTRKMEVTHYAIKRASKALCAYIGDWEFLPDLD